MALLDTVFQSIILSVFSNILAQLITAYQANKPLLSISNINPVPIGQFVFYTIINVPINVYWQNWLEATFPGSKPAPITESKEKKAQKSQKEKQDLDVKNTLIKFALDQIVGAVVNIPIFLATMGFVRGQSLDQILASIQNDSWSIYKAGLTLWPAVSAVSFAAIPVEKRVLFGSLAGVVWNIYLSLKAAS